MHARNRSPGNGYRANAMGIGGVTTASRISPESSMRGGYNSEYRGYSRGGFGRGQSRQFHRSQPPPPTPPPPPQKGGGDIFMEAGRLATEYLVSKGLLPANVLSGKWQNGCLKNQVGAQEGDGAQLSLEGRTSALSRLGGAGSDLGPGRRRYMDEYNPRSSLRGRRRNGSFKNYGSDWRRDFGRSGSWSERSRASMDGEDDSDVLPRHRDEQQVSNDGESVSQNSIPELAPESDAAGAKESDIVGDTLSASEKYKSIDDAGEKASASTSTKDLLLKTGEDEEPVEKDSTKASNAEADEVKDGQINDEMELQNTEDDMAIMASPEEGGLASESNGDLLKLSCFAKVPTRTRTSMVVRSSKVDHDLVIVDENTYEGAPSKESGAHVEDLTVDNLSGDGSSEHTYDSKAFNLDNSKVSVPEDELNLSCSLAQGSCTAPVSFLDRASEGEQPDFGGINSMIMERGEKRALDDGLTSTGSKKSRELDPFEDAESDGSLSMLEPLDKRQTSEEPMTSESQAVILPSDEKRLFDISLYPKGDIEPCMEYTEEKQLFPGSFKTCDLNLMEASDANENHDTNPVLIFPSDTEKGKQAIPVDIDLSMNNNPRISSRYGKCIAEGKDIEVIDLENDSAQEDKDSNISDRRTDNVFTGLGGFSNNAVNANDIPDAQDGYGLMISELLGNDIPNCSSVPDDMNSLHNDMGLHNGEGILGDDDSIYMSFGEIPISFLRVWEQPTQEYGKPF